METGEGAGYSSPWKRRRGGVLMVTGLGSLLENASEGSLSPVPPGKSPAQAASSFAFYLRGSRQRRRQQQLLPSPAAPWLPPPSPNVTSASAFRRKERIRAPPPIEASGWFSQCGGWARASNWRARKGRRGAGTAETSLGREFRPRGGEPVSYSACAGSELLSRRTRRDEEGSDPLITNLSGVFAAVPLAAASTTGRTTVSRWIPAGTARGKPGKLWHSRVSPVAPASPPHPKKVIGQEGSRKEAWTQTAERRSIPSLARGRRHLFPFSQALPPHSPARPCLPSFSTPEDCRLPPDTRPGQATPPTGHSLSLAVHIVKEPARIWMTTLPRSGGVPRNDFERAFILPQSCKCLLDLAVRTSYQLQPSSL